MNADPLADLRHHWGGAYNVLHPAPDVWLAIRRDNQFVLRAADPDGLRLLIIADYSARPVPRP